MGQRERFGWLAGVAGAAALGAVAVGATARRVAARTVGTGADPYADIDFTTIYDDAASTVTTDDGLALAVRTVDLWDSETDADGTTETEGAADRDGGVPELTVVFVHGFSLRMASWHMQRQELARRWAGRRIRLVFFDHRGHGKSDPAPDHTCTIAQIADDTAAVIKAVAPAGPVVLVGHSMGGMALMALARRHHEMFAPDGVVSGVALIATNAHGLTDAGLGEGLQNPIVDAFRLSVRHIPRVVQAGRGISRAVVEPVLVAGSFGPGFASPAAGRAVEKMIQNTPIETIVNFLHALETHDESTALPILADVPTVVVCGDADRLTPPAGSVRMYAALGKDSALVVAEGAGHMVTIEAPDEVTGAIVDLVERRRHAMPPPRRSWWRRNRR